MQMGSIIRKYRLEKGLTQEEVARRLGVSAPAVNKWEKGNSMPDITLLSPIARLLDITLDTLLSHTDSLPDEEANRLIVEAHEKLKTEPFDAAFAWAKQQLQAYPNSDFLALYMARILHSHIQMQESDKEAEYSPYLVSCYQRVLESGEERLKSAAADTLYYHYLGNKQFDKAEEYLAYFSEENPERKRKLATVYRETGRKEEAWRMYEELLYAGYQNIQSTFYDMYHFSLKDEDFEQAHYLVEKLAHLARLFEMGEYHEVSSGLELAMLEQDADSFLLIMQRLLGNIESLSGFTKSSLYAHMKLKQPDEDYYREVRQSLLDCLHEEECAFVRGDERVAALLEE